MHKAINLFLKKEKEKEEEEDLLVFSTLNTWYY